MQLEQANGGAFTNPMEVRKLMRATFWEGTRPEPKEGEGSKELEPDKMDELAAMAEMMRAARAQTPPPSPDGVESG